MATRTVVTRAIPQHLALRRLAPALASASASASHARSSLMHPPSRPYSASPTTLLPPAPSSASPTEVTHFNALASTWWDPHGPSRLLHLMNPLRHRFIETCLLSSSASPSAYPSTPTLRYLDVGCGGGIFAESAARLPSTASVLAIDPSTDVLAVARTHARQDPLLDPSNKLTYENTTIEQLPPPTNSPNAQHDILTIFEVIEHIDSPGPFLQSCLPFVKPGGWLIISTIARTWTSWLTTKLVAEDIARIVPRGTHTWEKYINEPELRGWFAKQSDWGQVKTMGVIYVPGLGWREVSGGEAYGNYFFGVRKSLDPES